MGRLASARAISTRRRSPPDSAIDGVLRCRVMLELLEQRVEVGLAAAAVGLHHLEHRADIVLDIEAAEDRRFLRQIADAEAGALVHRQMRDVVAVEFDDAAVAS